MSCITELSPRITENLGDLLGQVHHFSDGLYAKQMHIPAGYVAGSHMHAYSHLSILAKGDVLVEVDGVVSEFSAPACIEIKAGREHRIFAKTDTVWFCVHATDAACADEVDAVLIQKDNAEALSEA